MIPKSSAVPLANAASTRRVDVWTCVQPGTVVDVQESVRRGSGRLSVSGARHSPDTQFALEGALHLDLSALDHVVRFEPLARRATVQAGVRWSSLFEFLLPHGLVPRIAPDFSNFTVGGSVAANLRGAGVGTGPVGEGVRSLVVVLADGSLRRMSRQEDPDAFRAVVGGFGGLGAIVEIELDLVENTPLLRKHHVIDAEAYPDFLRARILSDPGAVLHRAGFAGASLETLRSETWVQTRSAVSLPQKLHAWGADDPLGRLFSFTHVDSAVGRAARRLFVDRWRSLGRTVHWRSLVASPDLRAIDPRMQSAPRHLFQSYVVPLRGYLPFVRALREIVASHGVRLRDASVVATGADTSSHLSLSGTDGLVFTLLLGPDLDERGLDPNDAERDSAVWTRELVQAAIDVGGGFDPSDRMHATREQFGQAFAGRGTLLAVKERLDPRDRFGNGLWSRYIPTPAVAHSEEARFTDGRIDTSIHGRMPAGQEADALLETAIPVSSAGSSEFRAAMATESVRDNLYRLLREIAPGGCGPRLFRLLEVQCRRNADDELIYRALAAALFRWRGAWYAPLTRRRLHWVDALQPRLLAFTLDARRIAKDAEPSLIDGVAELGTRGRHIAALRRECRLSGDVLNLEGFGPFGSRSSSESQDSHAGRVLALRGLPARMLAPAEPVWAGLPRAPEVLDLVVLHAGLSQVPASSRPALLDSIAVALRRKGTLVMLEHDADCAQSALEASVANRLTSLCEGLSWAQSAARCGDLRSADEWVSTLASHGLHPMSARVVVPRTALGDRLIAFGKRDDC